MKTVFHDEKLGDYYYDGAWVLEKKLIYNEYDLSVYFQAFGDEDISGEQREAYAFFLKNAEALLEKCSAALIERFGERYKERISFNILFFNRYNEFGLLGEDVEDDENGIAAQFDLNTDKIIIGEQNILL